MKECGGNYFLISSGYLWRHSYRSELNIVTRFGTHKIDAIDMHYSSDG